MTLCYKVARSIVIQVLTVVSQFVEVIILSAALTIVVTKCKKLP